MKHPFAALDRHFALPEVRRVESDRPFAWFKAGWEDLAANPAPGIAYGLLFGIAGDLILLASLGEPHLFTLAISGFFLVAPLLAAGLYELSRRRAAGERPSFIASLAGLQPRAEPLAQFGLVVALVALVWERASSLLFAMLGGAAAMETGHFITQVIATGEHQGIVAAWFIVGGALALFAFAISVVSVPMILDRKVDVATAIATSLRAFAVNLDALVLWAGLIVAFTLLGFATLLFGLVVLMPVLGHASWHAYRELVE